MIFNQQPNQPNLFEDSNTKMNFEGSKQSNRSYLTQLTQRKYYRVKPSKSEDLTDH